MAEKCWRGLDGNDNESMAAYGLLRAAGVKLMAACGWRCTGCVWARPQVATRGGQAGATVERNSAAVKWSGVAVKRNGAAVKWVGAAVEWDGVAVERNGVAVKRNGRGEDTDKDREQGYGQGQRTRIRDKDVKYIRLSIGRNSVA